MFLEQTYENIKKRILDKFPKLLNKSEGSYSDTLISPTAEELAKAYMSMGDILSIGFIEDGFYEYLDKRVAEFGVYRKQGTKSTGAITVKGQDGAVIINGTNIIVNDLKYVVLNDIELPTENTIYVEAVEVGYEYNVLSGTEFKLVDPNVKIESLIAKEDFKGGIDIETDEELKARFKKIVSDPATSGNKAHYEQWALEVDGVGRAVVYPLWNGNGTVKVMCVGSDGNPIEQSIIDKVKYHIDENKPIGCALTVITPTILDISVVASVKVKEGYVIEDLKAELEEALSSYLRTVTSEVVYSKVYGLLINLAGVGDISSLTVNGGTSNIQVQEDKISKLKTVELNEVV